MAKRRTFNLAPGVTIGRYFPAEEDYSLADIVATLPLEQQEEVMKNLDHDRLIYDFSFWGRPSQLEAINSKAAFVIALAGRGWG